MKLQNVWTRVVVVVYLVAVVGICLYVPTYLMALTGEARVNTGYGWVWNMKIGGYASIVNCTRVALKVVSLTAITGVLFLIGSLMGGRKRGKQSDPSTL